MIVFVIFCFHALNVIVFSDKYLLHWSNIVGASHSKNYIPWQYGAYATKGVQEVCEYGYPKSMELEIKQHVGVSWLYITYSYFK